MPKITELAAATAITDDDLMVIVDAPGGSATTKKITALDAKTYLGGGGGGGGGLSLVDHATPTGATETLDLAAGNVHRVRWDANVTLSLTGVPAGLTRFYLLLYHDATTSTFTVTWWSNIEWVDDAAGPMLPSATANAEAFIEFWTFNGGSSYRAMQLANFFP